MLRKSLLASYQEIVLELANQEPGVTEVASVQRLIENKGLRIYLWRAGEKRPKQTRLGSNEHAVLVSADVHKHYCVSFDREVDMLWYEVRG